jgi:hypothetical protein
MLHRDRVKDELELLSAKLRQAEAACQWARARGDEESLRHSRLRRDAIVAEHARALSRLPAQAGSRAGQRFG